jgi:hypothetical protein
MVSPEDKAERFKSLHEKPGTFIIPTQGTLGRRACSRQWASTHWQRRAWAWPSRSGCDSYCQRNNRKLQDHSRSMR